MKWLNTPWKDSKQWAVGPKSERRLARSVGKAWDSLELEFYDIEAEIDELYDLIGWKLCTPNLQWESNGNGWVEEEGFGAHLPKYEVHHW